MSITTVRGVLTQPTELIGPFTTPDGAALVADKDRCLVVGQSDPKENGIYNVRVGAWEHDPQQDMFPGLSARVYGGQAYKHSEWLLDQEEYVQAGVASQTWTLHSLRGSGVPGSSLTRDPLGHMVTDVTGVEVGTYQNPNLTIGKDGRIIRATSVNIVRSYIEGLEIQYRNATTITVFNGAAFNIALNKVVELNGVATVNAVLTPNTIQYVYLYEVNGVGQIEISPIGPATPYVGTAANKLGDDSMRYLGRYEVSDAGVLEPGSVRPAGYEFLRGLNFAPIGTMHMYGGASAPTYWFLCQGQLLNIQTYQDLYKIIGITYGYARDADGKIRSFKLPDMRGRSPVGHGAGKANDVNTILTEADLTYRSRGDYIGTETSDLRTHDHGLNKATQLAGGGSREAANGGAPVASFSTGNATLGNDGWGNMQPGVVVNFIIRYA